MRRTGPSRALIAVDGTLYPRPTRLICRGFSTPRWICCCQRENPQRPRMEWLGAMRYKVLRQAVVLPCRRRRQRS